MKELEQAIIRGMMAALLMMLALLFVLAAVGFLLTVAYQVSEPVWGAAGAAAVVAGLCLGLALILLGVASMIGRRRSAASETEQAKGDAAMPGAHGSVGAASAAEMRDWGKVGASEFGRAADTPVSGNFGAGDAGAALRDVGLSALRDPGVELMVRAWIRRSPWEAMATAVLGGIVYVRVPEARHLVLRTLTRPVPRHPPHPEPSNPGPSQSPPA